MGQKKRGLQHGLQEISAVLQFRGPKSVGDPAVVSGRWGCSVAARRSPFWPRNGVQILEERHLPGVEIPRLDRTGGRGAVSSCRVRRAC